MANAWGELSWNSGLWGQQSDAIGAPTGLALNSSVGDESAFNNSGWGRQGWNTLSWGVDYQDANVDVTGEQLNLNTGSVGVSGEINLGWGRLTWGENAWGIGGDVLVTGIGLSAGIGTGSVKIDVAPELTGEQQNLTLANVEAFGNTEIYLQDNPLPNLTIEEGTVDPSPDASVTGIGISAS